MADFSPLSVSTAEALSDLACADAALLAPLQASAEFAAIGPRLHSDVPLDTWEEDALHFFVFQLRPADGGGIEHAAGSETPVAVFIMTSASDAPISAVVVTPGPDGAEPEVQDLRTADEAESAAVSVEEA